MRWRRHDPALHEATWKYLCFGEFALLRLGLEPAIDPTMAARTMASDIGRGCWWPDALDAGIGEDRLATIRPSGEWLGCIPAAIARAFGLPEDVAVVQGGHDQPMGALGAGDLIGIVALPRRKTQVPASGITRRWQARPRLHARDERIEFRTVEVPSIGPRRPTTSPRQATSRNVQFIDIVSCDR